MPDPIFEEINRHIAVSRETFDRLRLYHNLLCKWQPKVNLVGPATLEKAWQRHFLDSLQIAPYIKSVDNVIIDMGTGAGFPGMVLAIYGYKNIHLIESDAKKNSFLKEVKRITKTDVIIHQARMENVSINNIDYIISRACAPLEKLFDYSSHFVSHETICLFHKGKNYSKDIENAKREWNFETTILPSVIDTQSVILKIENLKSIGLRKREYD